MYEHVSLCREGVVPKSKRYDRDSLVRTENKKYKLTYLNDICYNPANLKFGVICRNTYTTGIFSPIYITFEVVPDNSFLFVEHYLRRDSFIDSALSKQEGTVFERMSVKPSELLNMTYIRPVLNEQSSIGSLFQRLDTLITLHQCRVIYVFLTKYSDQIVGFYCNAVQFFSLAISFVQGPSFILLLICPSSCLWARR